MGTGSGTRGRTFLHVGAPKSGTTYLQERLRVNAHRLEQCGVHYPVARPWARASVDPGFRAALDLLGRRWGVPAEQISGQWTRLARKARRHRGSTVISHEVLAGATVEDVRRAVADLDGQEVHVVFTARDLSRALPGAWQESIKQGRTWTYSRFLERSRQGKTWFSRALDPTRVLGTWGSVIAAERVHLVVTPPPTASRQLLWDRFAEVTGIAPGQAPIEPAADNASLGAIEAQLLRLVNCRLDEGGTAHRSPRAQFLVNDVVAPRLRNPASGTDASRPVQLPPDAHDWVSALTEDWIQWISARGIDVVGDLAELRPERTDAAGWVDPDDCAEPATLGPAAEALAALVDEAVSRPVPLRTRIRRRRERSRAS